MVALYLCCCWLLDGSLLTAIIIGFGTGSVAGAGAGAGTSLDPTSTLVVEEVVCVCARRWLRFVTQFHHIHRIFPSFFFWIGVCRQKGNLL